MGRANAEGIAQAVRDGFMTQEVALTHHLQSNHYPPVHTAFVGACVCAIIACREGDTDQRIQCPNGRTMTAAEIIDGLHLEAFLPREDDGEE